MINLGDKVKDPITGFVGIVVCRHEYLNGCARVTVQPPVNKAGELQDEGTFDEPQLKVVRRRVIKGDQTDNGGPSRYMPAARPTGKR